MSIKEGSKRASAKSQKGERFGPYVVPETAIRDFIGSLSIHDVETTAAKLQIVADATRRALDSQSDRLDRSGLQLLRDLAGESTNKHYRRIMKAIIAGVGQGPLGIDAAHLTASYALEMAFRWTPDYFLALREYGDKLRTLRPADESSESTIETGASFPRMMRG